MVALEEFIELIDEFQEVADFVTVYIAEAHPTDSGDIDGNFDISTHKSIKERIKAALFLLENEELPCPLLVDSMINEAKKSYAALPERLYIIKKGRIVYEGGVGPMDYKVKEVEEWLQKYRNEINK
ncbi:type I iodothyronine deiodinase-like [Tachypleus tridentatus]|uniref:type I iodothyronine deiodinase-like n=1 Tax=Tachypleus tridentatus TaxID=6853 RepID=UPI003FCF76BB